MVEPVTPPRPTPARVRRLIVIMRFVARAHVAMFRLTNGRIGSRWRLPGMKAPLPVLLVDHVGRASGKRFTTPVIFLADGPDLLVVASRGGLPTHPQWLFNLRACPETTVALRGERSRPVRARVADAGERARLWPRLVAFFPGYAEYQAGVDREIAVVVLQRR